MTPRQLTCAEAFSRLDDYLDRELNSVELEEVEAHLRQCAVCAREFGVEREVLDALKAKLRRLALPPGLKERITKAIEAG
ncbi:MAG TPA: zf-HC2 domain-containing protein [Gemmatimonadales bacterium]|nr:zf-HC2 domain-containing protein [Gemmatimonadales bacterium]